MHIAIYSRKSKFTGKGESVENQIQLCRAYASSHFGSNNNIQIYEDEGFSGGSTERPQYQQMLHDAHTHAFEILICYRLDRISRNISDFAALITDLQQEHISFVSIREQFDTSTPMGRAMMYIASVFAQLERETIAERIRDNMIELAKTGRWLGGITPTGFESAPITAIDDHGRTRKAYVLQAIPEEMNLVQRLYDAFLNLQSLTKLETYCLQNGLRSKNERDFSRFALRSILENPVYACADDRMFSYLKDHDFEIYSDRSDFDGRRAVMAYNKTLQVKHHSAQKRSHAEWIIAVGKHRGIISSDKWIAAQNLLLQNKSRTFRKVRSSQSLLSGLLRCASCGSFMRPKPVGRTNGDNQQVFYYMCERKEKSRRALCRMKNANGNELDSLVIEQIKHLSESGSTFQQKLGNEIARMTIHNHTTEGEIQKLLNLIQKNETAISRLVETLAIAEDSAASTYIVKKINELHSQNADLKERSLQLREMEQNRATDIESFQFIDHLLSAFAFTFDMLDIAGKRNLLHGVVDTVTWDGEHVRISLFSKKK
ncbi:recombinase family protein [Ethanoligenens sp.]|uniref:recombinase family protein n=1 Tax=Ethanoligenens sp. TaxID=2099655 RepID=UPI0039E75A2C